MPPEIDDLATGRSDVLRRRRGTAPTGRIRDSRGTGLLPGISNRDARRAYDARVRAMRSALAEGDGARLGRGLGEALQLGLWRARKLTGFDALAEDVVGLPAAEARDRAQAWAAAEGLGLDPLPEASAALWLRAEVVLASLCPEGRVWLDPADGKLSLQLPALSPDDTARVFGALARSARELDRVMQRERPAPRPRSPRGGER